MQLLNTKLAQLYNYSLRRSSLLQRWIEKFRLSRPFKDGGARILIVPEPNAISFSQIYPFFYYEAELHRRWGVQLRAQSRKSIENGGTSHRLRNADVIMLQTWFDFSAEEKQSLFARLRRAHPDAQIVYRDSFAPLDLRLAELMHDDIRLYVKKQLFRDRNEYGRVTHGDTNLMDFYGALYGIDYPETEFRIPDGFLDKTIVGPGFFTADYMLTTFQKPSPPKRDRPIDLHARLGAKGSAWYSRMRQHALSTVNAVDGINTVTAPGRNRSAYLDELSSSKICFSPFGYGEVCWRDYEAIMCGSLLLKPDMSHAITSPDIFVANETYVPVGWDFSDLKDKILHYLANANERQRIIDTAYRVLHEYVTRNRFVDHMSPLIELVSSR